MYAHHLPKLLLSCPADTSYRTAMMYCPKRQRSNSEPVRQDLCMQRNLHAYGNYLWRGMTRVSNAEDLPMTELPDPTLCRLHCFYQSLAGWLEAGRKNRRLCTKFRRSDTQGHWLGQTCRVLINKVMSCGSGVAVIVFGHVLVLVDSRCDVQEQAIWVGRYSSHHTFSSRISNPIEYEYLFHADKRCEHSGPLR